MLPRLFKALSLVLVCCAALGLGGCATTSGPAPQTDLSALGPREGEAHLLMLANRYKANPRDKATMLAYADALREQGQADQAVAVLEAGTAAYPQDNEIRIGFARALTAAGRFQQALNVVNDAIIPQSPDWRALLVKGAILDQTGHNAQAREVYAQALTIAPDEAAIEGNLGLSYAMSNDLPAAEKHLRRAVTMHGVTSRIWQNLALVVGLQGRFGEARKIYAKVLPPDQVDANMAYVQAMLTQQDRWKAIRKAG